MRSQSSEICGCYSMYVLYKDENKKDSEFDLVSISLRRSNEIRNEEIYTYMSSEKSQRNNNEY